MLSGSSNTEQMGRVLQRTSISTNIKERLDFSCAVFGPDGGLVSNAPHIPVHLGAMQETVQFQVHKHTNIQQITTIKLSNVFLLLLVWLNWIIECHQQRHWLIK